MLMEKEELFYPGLPSAEYFRSTGVFRAKLESGVEIVGVSGNTWEEYSDLLKSVSPTDRFVASPELITSAGMSFDEMAENTNLINQRIEELVNFSTDFKETVFVLGTPLFVNERPRNSVLVIKAGEIVGVTNKRFGATDEENQFFEMIPEETPLLLPNTNTAIVICSDLVLASMYAGYTEDIIREILRLSGKEDLIGRGMKVIPNGADSILLVSCWSVGGRFVAEGQADEYYRNQLRNITWRLMRETPVKEMVIIDRVPTNLPDEVMRLTPTRPYNGVLKKRN